MRSSEDVACASAGPCSRAPQVQAGLFASHGLPPETTSPCHCPMALLCLKQSIERDFLTSGTSLFCLKT